MEIVRQMGWWVNDLCLMVVKIGTYLLLWGVYAAAPVLVLAVIARFLWETFA